MSNVLIGIIGVILFIGLALAGALFLGPRFQEATITSRSSAVVQALSQVANAANMYQTQEGKALRATNYSTNVQTLVDERYLKTRVSNPTNGDPIITVDVAGYGRDLPIDHVYTTIGNGDDQVARAICKDIEKRQGNPDPEASMTPITDPAMWATKVAARRSMGCFLYATSTPSKYSVYMVI
jgi:type II secretory pathway pseudopilin PulG